LLGEKQGYLRPFVGLIDVFMTMTAVAVAAEKKTYPVPLTSFRG
jgi:hypothetical protein